MFGREHAVGHPALTDQSTGLANRLHFELVYSYLFHGADRGVPLTVMLLSTLAHSPDLARALGERIQRTTRSADLVAYLGNGRFAILLLGSNLPGGRIACDRVDEALENVATGPVSIGLAGYKDGMKEPSELLAAADGALRAAEKAGGGVEVAQ